MEKHRKEDVRVAEQSPRILHLQLPLILDLRLFLHWCRSSGGVDGRRRSGGEGRWGEGFPGKGNRGTAVDPHVFHLEEALDVVLVDL
jgi:hypothetical protein